jgi:hypothetical protein
MAGKLAIIVLPSDFVVGNRAMVARLSRESSLLSGGFRSYSAEDGCSLLTVVFVSTCTPQLH